MTDIVERLLKRGANALLVKEKPDLHYDAVYEIERLRAENDGLRKAVKEAKDAEHQRWVKALLKVLPEEKAALFREICVAAAMGESDE